MSQPDTPDATAQEQIPASMTAAAQAYQAAMQQQPATLPTATIPAAMTPVLDTTKDVVMTEGTPDRPAVSSCAYIFRRLSAEYHAVASNPSRRSWCSESSSSKDRYPFTQYKRHRCHFSGYVSAPRSRACDSQRGASSWCANETVSE